MAAINIQLAGNEDLGNLVAFLAQPSVDRSFVKPLSEREQSIRERVSFIYHNGEWILAKDAQTIAGCLGLYPQGARLEISTVAVAETYQGRGVGSQMMDKVMVIAEERYSKCKTIEFDSWEGNSAMEGLAQKDGFTRTRVYEDPQKRPPHVRSVVYERKMATTTLRRVA